MRPAGAAGDVGEVADPHVGQGDRSRLGRTLLALEQDAAPGAVVGADVVADEAPAQRKRYVERLGQVGDLLLCARQPEQRLVRAESVEAEALAVGVLDQR